MLRFLLDEHLRGGLWRAILRHNALGSLAIIDAVRVGDPPDLSGGSADPAILVWAERENRILITMDVNTMPAYLDQHIQSGLRSPGMFVIGAHYSMGFLVSYLELVTHAGNSADFENAVTWIA